LIRNRLKRLTSQMEFPRLVLPQKDLLPAVHLTGLVDVALRDTASVTPTQLFPRCQPLPHSLSCDANLISDLL